MRTVKIYKSVKRRTTESPDQAVWVKDEISTGIFHSWGMDYEEFENAPAQFSIAIVEMPDGSIKMTRADLVVFLPDANLNPHKPQ